MSISSGRYHRQQILPQISEAGQARLCAGHAVIIGVGALGTHLADTLARTGVGTLTLVDRDVVEWTNLQRQILFTEDDAQRCTPKALAAARAIAGINREVRIEPFVDDLTARNAERLLAGATPGFDPSAPTVLLDGTDNFETRFLLNDIAIARSLPLVYAGVVGTTGLTATILPGPLPPSKRFNGTGVSPVGGWREKLDSSDFPAATPWTPSPCLRCLFDDVPPPGSAPTCDTAGVLGPAVSIVAGFQAVEAIKILSGAWNSISRSLVEIDAWTGSMRRIDTPAARRDDCPCCARRQFVFLESNRGDGATILCGSNAVQITPSRHAEIDLAALAHRLKPLGAFHANEHILRGALHDGGVELTVFPTGRAIIKGAEDAARARAVYARLIGA